MWKRQKRKRQKSFCKKKKWRKFINKAKEKFSGFNIRTKTRTFVSKSPNRNPEEDKIQSKDSIKEVNIELLKESDQNKEFKENEDIKDIDLEIL